MIFDTGDLAIGSIAGTPSGQIFFGAEGDVYVIEGDSTRVVASGVGGGSLVYDSKGNLGSEKRLYIGGPDRITRIDPSAGPMEVFAFGFQGAAGLDFGPDGCLYISDRGANKVWRACRDTSGGGGGPADGNQPPTANDDVIELDGTSLDATVNVVGNDTDPEAWVYAPTVRIARGAVDGLVTNNLDGTVTYTPSPTFSGTDSFTYTVEDNLGAVSNEATVSVRLLMDQSPRCFIQPRNAYLYAPPGNSLFFFDSLSKVTVTAAGSPLPGVSLTAGGSGDVAFPRVTGTGTTDEDGEALVTWSCFEPGGGFLEVGGQYQGEEFFCLASATCDYVSDVFLSCIEEVALRNTPKEESYLALLRRVSDEILKPTEPGNEYAELYYRFSPEVVRLMLANPSLLGRTRDQLLKHRPLLEALLTGGSPELTREDIDAIDDVLQIVQSEAAPELRDVLQRLRNELQDHQKLARFGIEIAGTSVSQHREEDVGPRAEPTRSLAVRSRQLKPARNYGRLPLTFETNEGQIDSGVDYLGRGPGYQLYLKRREAVLVFGERPGTLAEAVTRVAGRGRPEPGNLSAVRMKLVGAEENASAAGIGTLATKSHYLRGSDPSEWRTGIPHYREVKYQGIYDGVDLVYHANQGQLEYDFVLAPGVDPGEIRIAFEGVDETSFDERGDILLRGAAGDLRLRKPVAYQDAQGVRKVVGVQYARLEGDEIGFEVASYDPQRPVTIDPVLSYSSYLGGRGEDLATTVAVDAGGNAYITGATTSADLSASSVTSGQFSGGGIFGSDLFVTKLNAAGTEVVYTTYVGGSDDDIGLGIALDESGNAYVTGATRSMDFPTNQPIQDVFGGGDILLTDAFVLKLGPGGGQLLYSSYLGGTGDDSGFDVAVDSDGDAVVVGGTSSIDFPIDNAIQPVNRGGERFDSDAFVAKINQDGSQFVYATYLGGSGDDIAAGVAVDEAEPPT